MTPLRKPSRGAPVELQHLRLAAPSAISIFKPFEVYHIADGSVSDSRR
jgi:hypothetical protein